MNSVCHLIRIQTEKKLIQLTAAVIKKKQAKSDCLLTGQGRKRDIEGV